jgi:hypothetical protein
VQLEKRKAEMHKGIKGESPPTRQTWPKHRCGIHPGPARNPLEQGGGERASLGCGRTAPSSAWPHSSLAVAWQHAKAVHGGFLIYLHPNRPEACINRRVELSPTHTSFGLYTSLPHSCILLHFSSILGLVRAI